MPLCFTPLISLFVRERYIHLIQGHWQTLAPGRYALCL